VFVRTRKEANLIVVTQPSTIVKLSLARSKVVYYPAGWLLSRVWQYQIRNEWYHEGRVDVVGPEKSSEVKIVQPRWSWTPD